VRSAALIGRRRVLGSTTLYDAMATVAVIHSGLRRQSNCTRFDWKRRRKVL